MRIYCCNGSIGGKGDQLRLRVMRLIVWIGRCQFGIYTRGWHDSGYAATGCTFLKDKIQLGCSWEK